MWSGLAWAGTGTTFAHGGLEALPLCREHHQEAHTMPDQAFSERYHLDGGIALDKTLCRRWKLKAGKEHAQ